MPTARFDLTSSVINGKIYAIGGDGGNGRISTVEIFDPTSNSWNTGASMPTPRHSLTSSVVNGKIYAIGGGDSNGVAISTVEVFDPMTNSWSTGTAMPTARFDLTSSVVNGKLYAIGGSGSGGISSVMEVFDPTTDSWSAGPGMPTARFGLTSSVVNGKIYVLGGAKIKNQLVEEVGTLEVFDPTTNSWSTGPSMPTARVYLTSSVVSGKIYAIGGWNYNGGSGGDLSTVEVFDLTTNSWSTGSAMPTARNYFTSSTVNGIIYAMGGQNNNGVVLSVVEVFNQTSSDCPEDIPGEYYYDEFKKDCKNWRPSNGHWPAMNVGSMDPTLVLFSDNHQTKTGMGLTLTKQGPVCSTSEVSSQWPSDGSHRLFSYGKYSASMQISGSEEGGVNAFYLYSDNQTPFDGEIDIEIFGRPIKNSNGGFDYYAQLGYWDVQQNHALKTIDLANSGVDPTKHVNYSIYWEQDQIVWTASPDGNEVELLRLPANNIPSKPLLVLFNHWLFDGDWGSGLGLPGSGSNYIGTNTMLVDWFKYENVPEIPIVKNPPNRTSASINPLVFVWNKIVSAIRYYLEVSTDPSFPSRASEGKGVTIQSVPLLVNDSLITDTSFSWQEAQPGQTYYWRVKAIQDDSTIGFWSATDTITTASSGVTTRHTTPLADMKVFPNPVSATTSLFYSLDYQASVSITVFDALGRIVSYPIQNQIQRAGSHEVAFDTKDFPNGLYWCRLAGEGIEQAAKLIINR